MTKLNQNQNQSKPTILSGNITADKEAAITIVMCYNRGLTNKQVKQISVLFDGKGIANSVIADIRERLGIGRRDPGGEEETSQTSPTPLSPHRSSRPWRL